jgi:AraC family transcriptional regulator, regulatory protein of adaptative response / DNA-3-methyladenine glycosylase II
VLGQQVSVRAAATLAGRLADVYGELLERPLGGVTRVFPSVETLADADLARLGMPGARLRCLSTLVAALAGGEIKLDAGSARAETRQELMALPGIGPWTTEYIAMRALRDPDAFLPSDLGVRRALARLGSDETSGAVEALSQSWRPYRAYAVQYLWASLDQTGQATKMPLFASAPTQFAALREP